MHYTLALRQRLLTRACERYAARCSVSVHGPLLIDPRIALRARSTQSGRVRSRNNMASGAGRTLITIHIKNAMIRFTRASLATETQ